jgi:hypothetical protein
MDYHGHGHPGRNAAWKPSTGDLTMPIAKPLPKEMLRASSTLTSADLLAEMAQDSGLGVSTDSNDLLIPRLRVIQKTSVAVDPQRPEYLPGARAGDFLLGISDLRSGSEGLEVIPAGMKRYYIEMGPDRIFVGRHDNLPTDAKPARDGNKPIHRRANGNLLEDVREFALHCEDKDYLLSCRGTAHTFARRLQTDLHSRRHPNTNRVLPSFASKYKLTAGPTRNTQGSWFELRAEFIGMVTDADEYAAAKMLNKIVTSGGYAAEGADENSADYEADQRGSNDPFNGL